MDRMDRKVYMLCSFLGKQMEGRVKRDVWYIENWSFFLDLKIIYVTVVNMFHGEKNAY